MNNLKQAEGHFPEPMPMKKTVHVVSGGSYGSTYNNKTPAENLISFLAWKEEFVRSLKNVKKADLPVLPDLITPLNSKSQLESLNNENVSKEKVSISLQQYKTAKAVAVGSIFDEKV